MGLVGGDEGRAGALGEGQWQGSPCNTDVQYWVGAGILRASLPLCSPAGLGGLFPKDASLLLGWGSRPALERMPHVSRK